MCVITTSGQWMNYRSGIRLTWYFIWEVRPSGRQARTILGRSNFFISCPLYFLPFSHFSAFFLFQSLCLISFLLFPCSREGSCMSVFSTAILSGTLFFRSRGIILVLVKKRYETKQGKKFCCSHAQELLPEELNGGRDVWYKNCCEKS